MIASTSHQILCEMRLLSSQEQRYMFCQTHLSHNETLHSEATGGTFTDAISLRSSKEKKNQMKRNCFNANHNVS